MATKADIQRWRNSVYAQPNPLSSALTQYAIAPWNLTIKEKKLEVLLFRAMMDYFTYHPAQLAAVVKTEETHQHYVCPQGVNGYCEISDVLFVIFSRKNNTLRMTHMQAKRKKITQKISLPLNNLRAFEFTIDPKQYSLLHWRLPFTNKGNSKYPVDTFCCPEFSDSIASYGVFYMSQNNEWHIAYEVTSLVGNPSHKKGVFYNVHDIGCYLNSLWFLGYPSHQAWEDNYIKGDNCQPRRELISTLSTQLFENELTHCHVGSCIQKGSLVGDSVIAYTAKIYDAYYDDMPDNEKEVVDAFREYFRTNDFVAGDVQLDENELPGNIVLIDADKLDKQE